MNTDASPYAIQTPQGLQDLFIVAGAVMLVALIAFIWLAYFRKQRTQLHGHSRRHRHHGKKRRRREHRQLNPTLAQTGGLPPIRTEEPPPAQPPPP
jgi:hypothetical protein